MVHVQTRINTFAECWPGVLAHMVETIAKAGLFYENRGDETRCFYCDCVVKQWGLNDDPWHKHAVANPYCYFVVSIKDKKENHPMNDNNHNGQQQSHTINNDNTVAALSSSSSSSLLPLSFECKVCLEKLCDTVLMPCRHLCVCINCYFELDQKCPTCRQDVCDFIKIFVS
jgi:hypothetical protein